jgi:tetratricopeptide (TPR) repeat protein
MALATGEPASRRGLHPLAPALVLAFAAAVCAAYLPVFFSGFVWDDDLHLIHNPVLLDNGLYRIWVAREAIVFWPTAFTSYWIEHQLWGLNPSGYHAVNVGVHAGSALLFYVILRELRFDGRVAGLAALLFVLHPQNVESVAWISQRKNLVAMLFFLCSVHGYLRFDRCADRPGDGVVARWLWYAWAVLALALGLLAKGSIAPLPFVLVLVLAWRRGFGEAARPRSPAAPPDEPWRRRIRASDLAWIAPFLVVSSLLTLQEVLMHTDAIGQDVVRDEPLVGRLATAGWMTWFYVWKSFVPFGLSFVYPRFEVDPGLLRAWIPTAGALAVLLLASSAWRRGGRFGPGGRALAFAIAYYALMIAPALGFADFYYLRYAPVADHYQYHAQLGLTTVVAYAWTRTAGRPAVFFCGAAAVLALLGTLTYRQCLAYESEETLWRDTLAKNPDSSLALNNLGKILARRGETDEALPNFLRAVEVDPTNREAWQNAGLVLEMQGDTERALGHFREALRHWPGETTPAAAIETLSLPQAHLRLGRQVARMNDVPGATYHFTRATRLAPDDAQAKVGLANMHLASGAVGEAIALYRRATELAPEETEAFGRLTLIYAAFPAPRVRDAARAIELGEHAARLTERRDAAILDALAAGYAEAGRFREATETAAEAARLATGAGRHRFAEQIDARRSQYVRGEPYRLRTVRLGWGTAAGYSGAAP